VREKAVTPTFLIMVITPVLLICGALLFLLFTEAGPKVTSPKQPQALVTSISFNSSPATATRPPVVTSPTPGILPGFTATDQYKSSSSPVPAPTFTPSASVSVLPVSFASSEPAASDKDAVARGLVVLPPYAKGENSRWIDLNLSDGFTRLMEGRKVIRELPSAWGYGKPGSADDYFSTPPGTYYIYEKRDELHFDETYTSGYFRGWVGFDPERANGFHSFILDRAEKIIDARLGPVSHGCVRTEDWRMVYDFAQVAMAVTVHN